MSFHVNSIDIGIEVGILHGVPASGMPQQMLSNIGSADFIEISGCGVAEEMSVQVLVHAQICEGGTQEILDRALRNSFSAFGA
jgi:hypothetical protein